MGVICAFIIGIITILYSRVFVESKLVNKEKLTYRNKKSGYIIFSFIGMFLITFSTRSGFSSLLITVVIIVIIVSWYFSIGDKNRKLKRSIVDKRNEISLNNEEAPSSETIEEPIKNTPEEKECPKCAEIIKAKAIICRFCGYDFVEKSFIKK